MTWTTPVTPNVGDIWTKDDIHLRDQDLVYLYSNKPIFRGEGGASAMSVPNTSPPAFTNVTNIAVIEDSESGWEGSPSFDYQVKVAGLYLVTAWVLWAGPGAGDLPSNTPMFLGIQLNLPGAAFLNHWDWYANDVADTGIHPTSQMQNLSTLWRFAANDRVALEVAQYNGAASTFTVPGFGGSNLSLTWLSA